MRKSMYRGKLRDTGTWVYWNIYGELCRLSGKRARLPIPNKYGESCYYHVHQIKHLIDPETIGEYTGLTDKNGKKIFEGDICRFENGDGEFSLYRVTWDYHRWLVVLIERFYSEPDDLDEFFCSCAEVIGNIHDNPELWEVQK